MPQKKGQKKMVKGPEPLPDAYKRKTSQLGRELGRMRIRPVRGKKALK